MRQYIDLHIHGRYARATSRDLGINTLEKWGKTKGLTILGTGDFTHPKWFDEITKLTKEDENGILSSKGGMKFIWQTEISFIFTQGGKGRRVHLVVLAPNRQVVEQIIEAMLKRGRVDYDGRPVFGMSCIEFVDLMMGISKDIEIIPAHAWTPWFSVFGSNSGFDSMEECFKEKEKEIFALETGLSSDPEMNWRISKLDRFTLISNSDSHSYWPWRMGRECNILDIELSYKNLINAIRTGKGFEGTVEVDPNYGKYHLDGHRACNVCFEPAETKKHKNICPKCGNNLTIGVLNRVEELADRPEGFKPKGKPDFYKLIPLAEIMAGYLGVSQPSSKKVFELYDSLVGKFGNELNIMLEGPAEKLEQAMDKKLAGLIIKNREGRIEVTPGYDGVYGVALIEPGVENTRKKKQKSLAEF